MKVPPEGWMPSLNRSDHVPFYIVWAEYLYWLHNHKWKNEVWDPLPRTLYRDRYRPQRSKDEETLPF